MKDLIQLQEPTDYFNEKSVDLVLTDIESSALAYVFDLDTPAGRKDCASLSRKVSNLKVILDDAGKSLVAGWKELAKDVDADRRLVRERLDALRDKVREPLTRLEKREKQEAERIGTLGAIAMELERRPMNAIALQGMIQELEAESPEGYLPDNVERFTFAKTSALEILGRALERAVQADKDAEDLRRLRESEAKLKQEKREAEIAAHAKKNAEIAAADRIAAADARTVQAEIAAQAAKRKEKERVEAEKLAAQELERRRDEIAATIAEDLEREVGIPGTDARLVAAAIVAGKISHVQVTT